MSEYPREHACPKCGQICAFTPRPDTQHYGEIRCPVHGHSWISKPSEDRKPKRKTNEALRKLLPEDMRSHCWNCLRTDIHLKSLRPSVCLQVHHVIEVERGGTDEISNLQLVCAECHAEIHRRREAFARYMKPC
jgi:uncharacterized Zn finger protein (UPF0148 family)